jgi:hypothetical protein
MNTRQDNSEPLPASDLFGGISQRDLFIAAALSGLCARSEKSGCLPGFHEKGIVSEAVRIGMLVAEEASKLSPPNA